MSLPDPHASYIVRLEFFRWCSTVFLSWQCLKILIIMISKLRPWLLYSFGPVNFMFNKGSFQLFPQKWSIWDKHSIGQVTHNVILLNAQFLFDLVYIVKRNVIILVFTKFLKNVSFLRISTFLLVDININLKKIFSKFDRLTA